jgi:surface protein
MYWLKEGVFAYIYTFNQDIGRWNVGNVTNMSSMFDEANVFNQDNYQYLG